MPGAAFRDRHLDLPLDLSGALFVATAADLRFGPGDAARAADVLALSGYTDAEKRAVSTGHLLLRQLARHRLMAANVHVTDAAVDALIHGYTREAGVWELAGALGAVCGKVVRRRTEGDNAPVEVTPAILAEMLAPSEPAGRKITGREGTAPGRRGARRRLPRTRDWTLFENPVPNASNYGMTGDGAGNGWWSTAIPRDGLMKADLRSGPRPTGCRR